ncbi:MAG: ABC transporter ATP-binding protein [Chlamydiae bacterium CG10_big_fil_rev_8_21_14_0_10_42_34]|nr:MAG: ABC transporter ATP-binding protein [Chlamydiae bacterium CG10_big_fil_rev_8_21_14_0_10_42_34]
MTLLLSCQSVSKSYATRVLFKDLSLSIFEKDRVGLIGPNGSGKTTFMKILAGIETANEGVISPRRGLKIGYVPQECDFADLSPEKILIDAIDEDLPDYEKLRLSQMWLSKLGFSGDEPSASRLSGGWKKRLAFAKELILSPDLLLLDEPTNHLDIEGILWLEKFLLREAPTYLLVSHDRYFLQNVTSRVVEIDPTYPKGIFAIDGSYSNFLAKKEEFLLGQIQQEKSLATKARRETAWLRAGVKARTTKSQSRIDEAHEILGEHADVSSRNRQKRAKIDFAASERQTRKLLSAKNIGKELGGRTLFRHLDFVLSPGTRMGLMGPNGSGKTTLLKLINDELKPDQGTMKRADALQVVYFDQHRSKLPLDTTLREALSPKGDYVTFRGQEIHVNGWCKRFLFSPDILDMPIGKLSGGERARISIAHLMLQSADLLLLDEPTNDLDIPTLETLEESLMEFPGAVVLITHDRCMLDRICNCMLGLGNTEEPEIFVDYSQWEKSQSKKAPKTAEKKQEIKKVKGKLSYLEKKEYEEIEGKIAKLEGEVKDHNHLLEKPEFAMDPQKLSEVCMTIGLLENQIEQLYLRWEELEKKLL